MSKEVVFNQCQDCGCPGAKIIIEWRDDNLVVPKCPYCGRKGVPFVIARGMTKGTPLILAAESWNICNRENKEGLG